MPALLLILVLSLPLYSPAVAQGPNGTDGSSDDRVLTSDSAVLCMSSYNLSDAVKAIGDEKWMRELRCITAKEGIPAVRLSPATIYEFGEPWRVRLTLPDGEGITMWGHAYSFKLRDGRPIPQ